MVALFSAVVGFAQIPGPIISEEIVGPAYAAGTIYTLSDQGMQLAATRAKGNKSVVTINGIDGPEFDQILHAVPTFDIRYDQAGYIREQSVARKGPVAFSRDGKRYAYAAVSGSDVIVILDGRRVYFYSQTADTMRSFRLMMDGKPITPPIDDMPQPHFSDDGKRWLLSAGKAQRPSERILIIDGEDAGYSGQRVRFTPDGKRVVCIAGAEPDQKLLVDGKSIMTAPYIERFKISATNDVAVIVRPRSTTADVFKQTLYLNGKLVPNSEGVADVYFSPDGKHWAAWLQRDMATAAWVMHDGKKQKDYAKVEHLTFSPDSSVLAYIASTPGRQFMVTNGGEDEGNEIIRSRPTFGQMGHTFVYAAGQQPLALKVYHNGKPSPVHRNVWGLVLSPNGERCAYFAGIDASTTDFIVDGEKLTRDGGFGGTAFFSSDSKHLAAATRGPNDGGTIYADGVFLPSRRAPGRPVEFTPDGRHLIIVGGPAIDRPGVGVRYFVDGDLVAEFSGRVMPFENSRKMKRDDTAAVVLPFGESTAVRDSEAKAWEYTADGRIIFIGPAVDASGSGPMKRVTVTPASGTSIATWFAAVKTSEEQALATAAAAKNQAESDKAANAAKREADMQAAAAKRKADYDAAVAAKTKAREDALAARQKAAAEAAEKRAKK